MAVCPGQKGAKPQQETYGDEMVQITVCGRGQFQSAEANVVQCLVVNAERHVGVLDQLVNGQGGVVGLHNCVGHLNVGKTARIEYFIHGKQYLYVDSPLATGIQRMCS